MENVRILSDIPSLKLRDKHVLFVDDVITPELPLKPVQSLLTVSGVTVSIACIRQTAVINQKDACKVLVLYGTLNKFTSGK
jgi:hypoxanthine-guanine phosphoribosyltransferase